MELNLDRLEPGRSSLELDGELILDLGEEKPKIRLYGNLDIDAMDQRILVHGSFQTRQEANCDRCSKDFELQTVADLELMILRNPARADEPEDDDDAWVIHQQRGVVDLAPSLSEAVVLAQPQKALCREDCRGLCPQCGADWNKGDCDCDPQTLDPRWEALRRLKDDEPA